MKTAIMTICLFSLGLTQGCSALSSGWSTNNTLEPRYNVEQDQPLGQEHGLKFDYTLLTQHLDILVLEGAELCFPATVVQAKTLETRIGNELRSGLLYDAANDLIIQHRLLNRLERQLQYVNQHQACILPKTPQLRVPGDIGKKISTLLNIDNQFATGSFSLNPKFVVRLSQAVELLVKLTDYRLLITGHADSTGNDKNNLILSQERADQVSRYIQIMGITKDRIDTAALGSNEPLIKGNQSATRLINRRVTIEVIEGPVLPQ
ncbi:MAG: OmpA family protein [Gammaproteobacteria bacterium]|nr:OmpA family protein [Gammaproteobacteria bacterium]